MQLRPATRRRHGWLAATCVPFALALLLASCGGGSPQATPVSPAVSPVASSVTVDLAQADRLYHEGSFEDAITIYSAAVLRGTTSQRQEALFKLAKLQYKQGDSKSAAQNVQALLADGPTPATAPPALLLLGMAEFAQNDFQAAHDDLQRYVDGSGAASAYAELRLADLAARNNDSEEAITDVDQALSAGLPGNADAQARFALASYQEQDKDVPSALATLDGLATDAASGTDRAEALWRLADLAQRSGDLQRSVQALVQLVQLYPSADRALSALGASQAAFAFNTRDRALVLFRHHEDADATQAYQALIQQSQADAGEAHYYLAILNERAGNTEAALTEYETAVGLLQSGNLSLLGQVMFDRALLLETLGRLDDAADSFAAIADVAPASAQAMDGLFKAGLQRYMEGRPSDAAALWQRYVNASTDADSLAKGHFWLARALQSTGDDGTAQLSEAASASPLDYYGLRATAMLAGESAFPSPTTPQAAPDWTSIEQWLATWAGPEDVAARESLFAGGYWTRGLELLQAGIEKDADAEFEQVLSQSGTKPWLLYRLSKAFADQKLPSFSARSAGLLALLHGGQPRALLAAANPLEFINLVTKEAGANGFSPLLLLALVRQESLYDPDAVSSADASGLTQVIPSTAAEIAQQLGETQFKNSDLLRAKVSLRFGAHYLGKQMEGFGGDLPAALAAYNGGAGNAGRWRDAAGGDPDAFLELIDFSETRTYVERVLENYARYLYAYGLTDEPSLPLAAR
jgi:soluble lytic murein transglycosylase